MILAQRLWIAGFVFAVLFSGCATTKLDSNRAQKESQKTRWEKGLEYSEQLYKQPVDFLSDEPFVTDQSKAQEQKSQLGEEGDENTLPQKGSIAYRVQIAAFQDRMSAQKMVETFRHQFPEELCSIVFSKNWWRVQIGEFVVRAAAEAKRRQLVAIGYPDAWIVQSVK